ncbi:hypothetical protein C8J56DRAFT_1028163 [Mycena floridula]|nr:hypothetical protein C8J56DRAFT_1028163 [Mycena floridula]
MMDSSDRLSSPQCGRGNHYIHDFPVEPFRQFPHLALTDKGPLEAEIPAIEADLEKRDQWIRGLQSHIAPCKDVLVPMESQLSQAKRDHEMLKSIIEPVRKLPIELLLMIFRECVRNVNCSESRKASSPWNISRVCRRWRQISTSFPAFWTSIRSTGRPRGKLLELALQRSGSSLLDVNLLFSGFIAETSAIVRVLLPSSPRWRSLILNVDHLDALASIQGCLGALKTLRLTLSGEISRIKYRMFEIAPLLRTVEVYHALEETSDLEFLPQVTLPLAAITRLTLDARNQYTPLEPARFDLCQNLTKATIFGLGNDSTLPDQPFVLPKLRDLDLTAFEAGAIATLFRGLRAPALTRLRLDCSWQWSLTDQESVSSLIRRSQCPLRSLELMRMIFPFHSFLDLLSDTSTVTHLVINHSLDMRPILEHLKWRTGHPVVLPNLARLSIGAGGHLPMLLDMVESRVQSQSPALKQVKIFRGETDIPVEEQTRLTVLRATGLSIETLTRADMEALAFF